MSLPTEMSYSLRWIPVGRRLIPFIRTWVLSRTDERGRRYFRRHGERSLAEFNTRVWREVPERRIRGGLLTLEQLRERINDSVQRWDGSRQVVYEFHDHQDENGALRVFIETKLVRSQDCGGCCTPGCVAAADLALRNGRLVARRKPIHSREEYAALHKCDFDRVVHSIDSAFASQRRFPTNAIGEELLEQLIVGLALPRPPDPAGKLPMYIRDTISGDVPELRTCESIFIMECKSADLSYLADAAQATEVMIWRAELKGRDIDALRTMPRLEKLNLQSVRLSAAAWQRFHWMSPNVAVTISSWSATDQEVQGMARIRGLKSVHFKAYEVTSLSLRKLTRCAGLQSLEFTYGRVSSFGVALLPQLPGLTRLSFEACRISPAALRIIGGCSQLEWLDLSCLRVSDRHCPMLAALPRLQKLVIDGTKVTDRGLAILAQCPTLKVLSIRRTPRISLAAIEAFTKSRPDVLVIAGAGRLGNFARPLHA